jgi:DNA end-binding protein Ku
LLLEQMHFHDEIRTAEGLIAPKKSDIQKKELQLALQLIEQLTSPFKPKAFTDTYSEALKKIIDAKAAGRTPRAVGTPAEPIRMRDLMQILQKSLDAEKKHRPIPPVSRKTRKHRTHAR